MAQGQSLFFTKRTESVMAIVDDMQAWVANAEQAGDDNYGAAAELMREAIAEIERLNCGPVEILKGIQKELADLKREIAGRSVPWRLCNALACVVAVLLHERTQA
jgi:hypothetical protein